MDLDILFLHAGGSNPHGLQGPYFPVGLMGLSALIEQKGFSARIVNLMLEKILNPDLHEADTIRDYPAAVIGIDLHWFVHGYEAIELARRCKQIHPSAKIVLGGLTASQFHTEILANFPFVDAVIRGDAERPLLEYVMCVTENRTMDLQRVPNLTYRMPAGAIAANPLGYKISQTELDDLDFFRFDLVNRWQDHLKIINTDYVPSLEKQRTSDLREYYDPGMPLNAWILYTGRGCPFRCSFCGGGGTAFQTAFGRSLILRSPETVAADMLAFEDTPVDLLFVPHSPLIIGGDYHRSVLDGVEKRLRQKNRTRSRLGVIFEDSPFRLDLDLIDLYLKIFDGEKSIFRLYLADIDEKASRFNNFPVDVSAVKRFLDRMRYRVHVMIGVLVGLPGQTRKSTEKMAEFLRFARSRNASVMVYTAELHPGSELIRRPDHYGVSLKLRSFMDYYRFLRHKRDKSMTYGYDTDNDIGVAEQKRILIQSLR